MRDEKGRFVKGCQINLGRKRPDMIGNGFKLGAIPWNKGIKMPSEVGRKISLAHAGKPKPHKLGSKNHFWKGGITKKNTAIRMSLEYRMWRKKVFERDSYTCVICKKVGGDMNADHIKPFSTFPEFRFDINNGRTLCVSCHKKTDTFGKKALKFKSNLESIGDNIPEVAAGLSK